MSAVLVPATISTPAGAVAETAWSVVASPNVPSADLDALAGIACASARSCLAVGSYEDANKLYKTLTQEWDGTKWSIVPSPNEGPALDDKYFVGVSCASESACMAVGAYANSNFVGKTLIESWDGTRWSPSPSVDEGPVSAGFCTAVGWYAVSKDAPDKTLVESSHRTSWSVVPSPNEGPAADDKHLDGVSCVSARACAAVGYYADVEFVGKTLVESWDGTSWSVVPSANRGPATDSSELSGVSCVSATSCIASGSEHMGLSRGQTLVERR